MSEDNRPTEEHGTMREEVKAGIGELIPWQLRTIAGREQPGVNLRDLHTGLGVRRDFSTWVKDRIAKYGFVEGKDYITQPVDSIVHQHWGTTKSTSYEGAKVAIDYHATVGMAKELALVENNDKGREYRRKLIELEERFKMMAQARAATPQPQPASAALNFADAGLLPVRQQALAEIRLALELAGPEAACRVWQGLPLPQWDAPTSPAPAKSPAWSPAATATRRGNRGKFTKAVLGADEQGTVDRYLAAATRRDPAASVLCVDLHRDFLAWCVRNGEPPLDVARFSKGVYRHGLAKARHPRRHWIGLALPNGAAGAVH